MEEGLRLDAAPLEVLRQPGKVTLKACETVVIDAPGVGTGCGAAE